MVSVEDAVWDRRNALGLRVFPEVKVVDDLLNQVWLRQPNLSSLKVVYLDSQVITEFFLRL